MYGITFELDTQELQMFYSHSEKQAFEDIAEILQPLGFKSMGRMYISQTDNLADVFVAVGQLKRQSWFTASLRRFETFRMEQLTDLTAFLRS